MNPVIFNFCLMLFWGGLALYLLVLGPQFAPNMMPNQGKSELLGMAAAMLSLWNLVRFLSGRSARRSQELTYREERNPKPASDQPKPVLHPEFQFDDPQKPPPGANRQNGKT